RSRSRGCRRLPLDRAEDAVHELARLVRGVALGEGDRLVDRDLGRHLAAVELGDRDAERAALDRAEPVGRPALRGGRDPLVQLRRGGGGGPGQVACPRVDLAGVLRAELLAGEIPLVEQEQRLAPRLAAGDHASSSKATSTATSRSQVRFSAAATASCARSPCVTSGSPRSAASSSRTSRASTSTERLRRTRSPSTSSAARVAIPSSTDSGTVIAPCGPVRTRGISRNVPRSRRERGWCPTAAVPIS